MQHFRHITTSFTLCFPGHEHTPVCQWGRAFPVEGTEWVGTGLAMQHVFHLSRLEESCGILHLASGRLLTADTLPTLIGAALWLRSLTDVTDWTQPAALLHGRADLRNHIDAARKQAFCQYTEMRGDREEGRNHV